MVCADSKVSDEASFGVLDLAWRLSLLHLLRFKFLTAFLVISLLALGIGLVPLPIP